MSTVTVDTTAAGLHCGAITVRTDGPTVLTLAHMASDGQVRSAEATLAPAGPTDSATVDLPAGSTTLQVC